LPCKELDKLTFTNSEVIKESRRFATYKIDLTKYDSQTAKEAIENFKIIGVPTLIFIDSKGKEAKRINKFVSAEELLKIMREIE